MVWEDQVNSCTDLGLACTGQYAARSRSSSGGAKLKKRANHGSILPTYDVLLQGQERDIGGQATQVLF